MTGILAFIAHGTTFKRFWLECQDVGERDRQNELRRQFDIALSMTRGHAFYIFESDGGAPLRPLAVKESSADEDRRYFWASRPNDLLSAIQDGGTK